MEARGTLTTEGTRLDRGASRPPLSVRATPFPGRPVGVVGFRERSSHPRGDRDKWKSIAERAVPRRRECNDARGKVNESVPSKQGHGKSNFVKRLIACHAPSVTRRGSEDGRRGLEAAERARRRLGRGGRECRGYARGSGETLGEGNGGSRVGTVTTESPIIQSSPRAGLAQSSARMVPRLRTVLFPSKSASRCSCLASFTSDPEACVFRHPDAGNGEKAPLEGRHG